LKTQIKNNEIQLIINTPVGSTAQEDDRSIRRTALAYKVPIITTIAVPGPRPQRYDPYRKNPWR
jgi:hypothetical protein